MISGESEVTAGMNHIVSSYLTWRYIVTLSLLVGSIPLMGDAETASAIPQASTYGSGGSSAELRGRVTDAQTGEPLAAANVFISNTTRGTTSDSTGRYSLRVPPGSHDLVATIVGYETKMIAVTVAAEDQVLRHDFELIPVVYELDELRVTDREDELWQERFERFRREFLGSSPNARKSHIENPYIIDLEVNERGTLTASADQPITIVNRALGYRVLFQLELFAHNERLGIFRYRGWSSYRPLEPESAAQAEQWRRNRAHTYSGSLQHFLRALAAGKTREEGFYVKPFGARKHPLGFRAIETEKIVRSSTESYLYRLSFEGDLQVIYAGSSPSPGLTFRNSADRGGDEVSWLELKTPSVRVHKLGYLYRPLALRRGGAMLEERMADALPRDYRPVRDSE